MNKMEYRSNNQTLEEIDDRDIGVAVLPTYEDPITDEDIQRAARSDIEYATELYLEQIGEELRE